MARIHMWIGDEQFKEGDTVTARCGVTVSNANAMPLPNPPTESIIFCRRCFGKFYVCAVTEGQSAIDLEAGLDD